MYRIKRIQKGKVDIKDIEQWLSNKEGYYSIEIKKFGNRTKKQNKYYWGWVLGTIANETGYSVDELHYYFKHKILGFKNNGFPSTKELSTEEFTDYVDKIKNIVAKLGIVIPE